MKMDEKATCRTSNLRVYKIIAICNHLISTQPAASSRPPAQARLKLIQNTAIALQMEPLRELQRASQKVSSEKKKAWKRITNPKPCLSFLRHILE